MHYSHHLWLAEEDLRVAKILRPIFKIAAFHDQHVECDSSGAGQKVAVLMIGLCWGTQWLFRQTHA